MTYTEQEKARSAEWKKHTRALPAEAKHPAPYVHQDARVGTTSFDFCIPAQFAHYNLLPEVRDAALSLFAELGIPWHAGVGSGPSNHLVSSQVQCVNALALMVADPVRLVRAFGELLGTAEVLEIEPGRYLTFEYIGPQDFFGEVPGGKRIRGAHCTSVDAAFLHRTVEGIVELVLVEWKYTESYRVRSPDPARDKIRFGRYGAAVADPGGPIRGNVLPFDLLLDEPLYQLVRQQLLARALEQSGAEGASRVRIVHVLSPANQEYQRSLARPEHRALGDTVSEVWRQLLRGPDRFVSVDSAVFLDPEITSREYVLRHAHDVAHDGPELLAMLEVEDAAAIRDVLEIDGDLELLADGIDVRVGRDGTRLSYPFTLTELRELIDDLSAQA